MTLIKEFTQQYLDDVYEIEKACFDSPWSKEDLENQIGIETSHFLIAQLDGKTVGYMGLQIFSGEGYVTNIAVLPQYRRRGIASALISKQLENKMQFITLEVRESNTGAINLYLKHGFEPVGKRRGFYTKPDEDAVIMTKYFPENNLNGM